MKHRILIISPHMDDEVLGAGGTICHHTVSGDHVMVLVVANRAYGHEYIPDLIDREKRSAVSAQKILGYQDLVFLDCPDEQLDHKVIDLVRPIEKVVSDFGPQTVYIPHRGDNNQDHRAVFEASRVVLRPFSGFSPDSIRVYEVPSSSDISPGACEWGFYPNCHVDISPHLDKKIAAMECYSEESRSFPHPRSPEALRSFAMKRGVEVGFKAAEAFMIIRHLIK